MMWPVWAKLALAFWLSTLLFGVIVMALMLGDPT